MEEARNTNDKTVKITCRDCGKVFEVCEDEQLWYAKTVKITCRDCGKVFEVCADEQLWYANRGWNLPERCPSCRKKRRKLRRANERN